MTTLELARLIGKTGTLTTKDGWPIAVTILDGRTVYGREQLEVTDAETCSVPSRWVDAERVTMGGE